jgi:predicted hotdog family 3-hydroxylacyl-ACP dehydratase
MLHQGAAFLRDPITVPREERVEHYRTQAARYKQLAEREDRPCIREGLLDLARQCEAMAEVLVSG